jgi:hypothetical protein
LQAGGHRFESDILHKAKEIREEGEEKEIREEKRKRRENTADQ